MALDLPSTHPVNNPIVLMTGADDSKNTRQYIKWLENTDLWIQANDYESISTIISSPFQPWTTPTPIVGTDGMQFAPGMSKKDDEQPLLFIQDLSRTSNMQYDRTENFWKWIDTYMYRIPDATM